MPFNVLQFTTVHLSEQSGLWFRDSLNEIFSLDFDKETASLMTSKFNKININRRIL